MSNARRWTIVALAAGAGLLLGYVAADAALAPEAPTPIAPIDLDLVEPATSSPTTTSTVLPTVDTASPLPVPTEPLISSEGVIVPTPTVPPIDVTPVPTAAPAPASPASPAAPPPPFGNGDDDDDRDDVDDDDRDDVDDDASDLDGDDGDDD